MIAQSCNVPVDTFQHTFLGFNFLFHSVSMIILANEEKECKTMCNKKLLIQYSTKIQKENALVVRQLANLGGRMARQSIRTSHCKKKDHIKSPHEGFYMQVISTTNQESYNNPLKMEGRKQVKDILIRNQLNQTRYFTKVSMLLAITSRRVC